MLAASWCSVPAATTGSCTAAATRQPSASAVRSSTSSQTTTNSSPPSRATVSAGRTAATIRWRERDQQRVAGGVAEEVVDALEVVEVDEQHRGVAALALGHARARGGCGRGRACGWRARSAGRAAPAWRICSSSVQAREADREHVGDRLQERALLLAERILRRRCGDERAVDLVAGVDRHADVLAARSSAPQAAISRGPSSTSTRSTPSRRAPARPPPRSARRPDAAQRALAERRDRRLLLGLPAQPLLGLSRSETSRPIASSSGPSSLSTMPQLISPMNSLPSLRRP